MHIDESLHSKDKTPCSTAKLKPGALSLKALESLTQSPNNAHLVIMMTPNQNIPLHRDIEFGCAIFKE